MRKLICVAGVVFIVVKHSQYVARKKREYEAILATIPDCRTCPLRRLNALVKTIVMESRLMAEEERSFIR